MKAKWIVPFVGCVLWAQSAPGNDGQVAGECAQLSDRVIAQAANAQLKEAEESVVQAMRNVTNQLDPACGGVLLHNLATVKYLSGHFAEAEVLAEKSVSTLESVLGPSTTGLLRPLHVLASARLEQGKIGKSREATNKIRCAGCPSIAPRTGPSFTGRLRCYITLRDG